MKWRKPPLNNFNHSFVFWFLLLLKRYRFHLAMLPFLLCNPTTWFILFCSVFDLRMNPGFRLFTQPYWNMSQQIQNTTTTKIKKQNWTDIQYFNRWWKKKSLITLLPFMVIKYTTTENVVIWDSYPWFSTSVTTNIHSIWIWSNRDNNKI